MSFNWFEVHNSKRARKKDDEPSLAGYTIEDQRMLREMNPALGPKVQIFMEDDEDDTLYDEDGEEIPKERDTIVCPHCENYNMKYWNVINKWYCNTCGAKVDRNQSSTKIESDDDMYLPTSQLYLPTIGEANRDTGFPFFASIDPDREPSEEQGYEIKYESADGRIQHRKVTDYSKLTEAIRF